MKADTHYLPIAAIVAILVVLGCQLLVGCGGGGGGAALTELSPPMAQADLPPARSVADVLAEIDAAPLPAGVDAAVGAELKAELKRALEARGVSQLPITPPTGKKNAVTDLEVVLEPGGTYRLEWTYVNVGDYNQDKLVGVSDFTPVGIYFDYSTESPDWPEASLADGIVDGLITVSDITPIGQFFNSRVAGYRVQRADTDSGPWSTVYTVDFGEPGGHPRKRFMYIFSTLDVAYYRVVPTDGASDGEPSNVVLTPGVPVAPEITDVQPQEGESGQSVTFTPTLTGSEPLTYAWDFGGGATPETSELAAPEVTLGEAGEYSASLTVSNSVDSATFPFTLTVTSAGAPQLTDVQPRSGLTGTQVTFTPTYTADGTPTFAWDFGGGATPDTSTDESPEVTLGAAGGYSASLTITDEYGSDDLPFTLTVLSGDEPPEITSVNPTTGLSGAAVTFSAIYTCNGTPTFAWDFGGGATPNTSSLENPLVTLAEADTTYTAELVITDEYGDDTFPFMLIVQDASGPARVHSVTPCSGESGAYLTLNAVVTGAEPITYYWYFDNGTVPGASSDESPTVLLGPPDVYSSSLHVSNAEGSQTYYFALTITPPGGYDDTILAIPQTYQAFPGDVVCISVECFETASPFYQLKGVRVSFPDSCEYRMWSFNVGARGGPDDDPDGAVWSLVAPDSLELPDDASLQNEVDLGGGRRAIDVFIWPEGGGEIVDASGELFNFELMLTDECTDGEQIEIGIERLEDTSNRTYYADELGTDYNWADDDNSTIREIYVCRPAFNLAIPPASGAGTSASPYQVAGGEQYFYQVETARDGDVTDDPRTTYHLTPAGAGDISGGVLTIGSGYQGIFTVRIDFDGYYSDEWYFEVPMTYVLPADCIVAIPSKTYAAYGEHVVVTLYTNQSASAFLSMSMVSLTLELGSDLVPNTLNVGSPGGGQTSPDGVWAAVNPSSFILAGFPLGDIGGGLQRIDFNVTPISGTEIGSATGALCNFEIEVKSDITFGFQTTDGGHVQYQDGDYIAHYWSDATNDHSGVPNSISVILPP